MDFGQAYGTWKEASGCTLQDVLDMQERFAQAEPCAVSVRIAPDVWSRVLRDQDAYRPLLAPVPVLSVPVTVDDDLEPGGWRVAMSDGSERSSEEPPGPEVFPWLAPRPLTSPTDSASLLDMTNTESTAGQGKITSYQIMNAEMLQERTGLVWSDMIDNPPANIEDLTSAQAREVLSQLAFGAGIRPQPVSPSSPNEFRTGQSGRCVECGTPLDRLSAGGRCHDCQ